MSDKRVFVLCSCFVNKLNVNTYIGKYVTASIDEAISQHAREGQKHYPPNEGWIYYPPNWLEIYPKQLLEEMEPKKNLHGGINEL